MGIPGTISEKGFARRSTLKNCEHHNDDLLERRSRFSNFTAEF